jgi:hypothetical protein
MKYTLLAAVAACGLGLAGAAHAQGGGGSDVPGSVQSPADKHVNPAYPESPKLRKELHEPPPSVAITHPRHKPHAHWPFHAPKPGSPPPPPPAEHLGGEGGGGGGGAGGGH